MRSSRRRGCLVHARRRGAQGAHRVRPGLRARGEHLHGDGACGAKTVEDVDKAGMRVIGIANTTTIRPPTRTLKNTTISAVTSVGEAVAMLRDWKADAFVLGRKALPPYVKQVPGSRITDGQFQQIGIAIATQKGNPLHSLRSRTS